MPGVQRSRDLTAPPPPRILRWLTSIIPRCSPVHWIKAEIVQLRQPVGAELGKSKVLVMSSLFSSTRMALNIEGILSKNLHSNVEKFK